VFMFGHLASPFAIAALTISSKCLRLLHQLNPETIFKASNSSSCMFTHLTMCSISWSVHRVVFLVVADCIMP